MSFAPTWTAIGAKLVLQEYSMAWVNGIFGLSHPPTTSLCTTLFDCGSRYTGPAGTSELDRKSTRLNSSHRCISYAVFCLKKKKPTALVEFLLHHFIQQYQIGNVTLPLAAL